MSTSMGSRSDHLQERERRLTEVRVLLRLGCRQPLLVVVAEELVEEVDGLVGDEALVLRRDEARPRSSLPSEKREREKVCQWISLLQTTPMKRREHPPARENVVQLRVQVDLVLVQVRVEVVGAQHADDLLREGPG